MARLSKQLFSIIFSEPLFRVANEFSFSSIPNHITSVDDHIPKEEWVTTVKKDKIIISTILKRKSNYKKFLS